MQGEFGTKSDREDNRDGLKRRFAGIFPLIISYRAISDKLTANSKQISVSFSALLSRSTVGGLRLETFFFSSPIAFGRAIRRRTLKPRPAFFLSLSLISFAREGSYNCLQLKGNANLSLFQIRSIDDLLNGVYIYIYIIIVLFVY